MEPGQTSPFARVAQRSGDLLAVALLSALAAAAVALEAPNPVRLLLGIPFLLLLPGYAMVAVLFPRRGTALDQPARLRPGERLALSMAFSVAVVPLLGLGLDATRLGLTTRSVTAVVLAVTLGACAVAALRRDRLPAAEVAAPPLPVFGIGRLRPFEKGLLAALVVGVVAAGAGVAYVASTPDVVDPATAFYLLGPNGQVGLYPTQLTLKRTGELIVGAENREGRPLAYEIRPVSEHFPNGTETAASPIVYPTLAFRLADGERHEARWNFTLPQAGNWQLRFDLHAEHREGAYRSLHLWIKVKE